MGSLTPPAGRGSAGEWFRMRNGPSPISHYAPSPDAVSNRGALDGCHCAGILLGCERSDRVTPQTTPPKENMEEGLTVAENAWLVCALWWTLRLHGVGLAWSWLAAPSAPAGEARVAATWLPAVLAPWFGLVLQGLTAVALAEAGLYSPLAEAGVLATLVCVGVILGRQRIRLRPHLPIAAMTLVVTAVVMVVPGRGEWIAGGLDQGIYVNQGMAVSRSGTFNPPPDSLLSVLSDEELDVFTRRIHNYTEYMATIPVDPDSRSIVHFFFRFTPAMVAVADRCGGLRAATRINLLTGWPALLTLATLLAVLFRRAGPVVIGSLLLLTHPIFVFQMHLPTSEMIQMMLVCGCLALLSAEEAPAFRQPCLAAVGLLAAMLNRFSFFPFGALLVAGWTWQRSDTAPPARLRAEWLVLAAGLTAGLGFDLWRCPVSIGRLDELVPPLLGAGGGLLGIGLAVAGVPTLRRLVARIPPVVLVAGVPAAALVFLVYAPFAQGANHVDLIGNVRGILPYVVPGAVLLATLGLVGACRPGSGLNRRTGLVLAFLAAGALLSLSVAAISRLYPWALRRQTIYTLPALVLYGAYGVHWLRVHPGRWQRWARPALSVLVVVTLADSLRQSRGAAASTDYNGLSRVIAAVVDQVPNGSLVVADHFVWSTSLRMIHDVPVLNGEVLWETFDPDRMKKALLALQRLEDAGWNVLFLTSTDSGLAPYQGFVPDGQLLWTSGPVRLADINDRPSQKGFPLHTRTKEFRLYDWP